VFEGKHYFTIIDFVKAYQHFADPEWDGEPEDQTTIVEVEDTTGGEAESCKICGSSPCICVKEPCDECGQYNCECKKKRTAKIRLGKNDIELQYLIDTSFYGPDGMPITSENFLKNLFGRLPEFFRDENELRRIWSNPDTRTTFLKSLHEIGYDESQLEEFKKVINAEKSDLFDVFEYISFAIRPISKEERIEKALELSAEKFDQNTQEFLIFVLESYRKDGYKSLSSDKISTFLELKFGGLHEAQEKMGSIEHIRKSFYSLQEILYL
jgi:type I restriction enzyme R subunit